MGLGVGLSLYPIFFDNINLFIPFYPLSSDRVLLFPVPCIIV